MYITFFGHRPVIKPESRNLAFYKVIRACLEMNYCF